MLELKGQERKFFTTAFNVLEGMRQASKEMNREVILNKFGRVWWHLRDYVIQKCIVFLGNCLHHEMLCMSDTSDKVDWYLQKPTYF